MQQVNHPDVTDLNGWLLWAVCIVVGTLSTIVGYFYKVLETKNAKEIESLRVQIDYDREAHTQTVKIEQEFRLANEECQRDRIKLSYGMDMLQKMNAQQEERIRSLESKFGS